MPRIAILVTSRFLFQILQHWLLQDCFKNAFVLQNIAIENIKIIIFISFVFVENSTKIIIIILKLLL